MGHREFFNSIAEKWDDICIHDSDRINRILDMACIAERDTVLDVGTGTGVLIPFLTRRIGPSGTIDAVDIAGEMLAVARAKHPFGNVNFIHADVLFLPSAENRYDRIICYSVFPHFRDKGRALATLGGYLKEGGSLTVCHAQGREAINHLHRNSHPAVAEDHLPDLETVKNLFTAAGLEPLIVVDSESMFVVSGRKPVPGK